MTNVVIVNAVYPPEPAVSAQIGRDLAEYLAGTGANVMVLCPYPSRPFGVEYSEFRPSAVPRAADENGVRVIRLPSFSEPRSRLAGRMRESLSFGWHVCRYLDRHSINPDVIYANSWPLFSQAIVAGHCARRGIPLVLHIQDIYPESLLNKLPGPCRAAMAWPLARLDRWTARQAAQLVVISENMRRIYVGARGVAEAKVATIPGWLDERRFETPPDKNAASARYGVPADRFTFLYLGNIGPAAGVELLIDAFGRAGLPRAQLVIVGDGSAKSDCMRRAKNLKLGRVFFVSDPDVANVPLLQSLGDVCLLPLRKGAGMSSIPSKLMAYLLSAKPVLATVDAESDTARSIREAQCGWVGEPGNTAWLAKKMIELVDTPTAELDGYGELGRRYGRAHFSRGEGVKRLGMVVLNTAGQNPPA
jgi:glycosyltransferase involved in cell wall biosynthesis